MSNPALSAAARSEVAGRAPAVTGRLSNLAALELTSKLLALANPVRVRLFSLLVDSPGGETSGRILASTVGLPESTVSHHLKQLRRAGYIESQWRGPYMYHRACPEALLALCTALDPNCCS
jgi:ArsR family transcriptional regulator